jgi:hypothetical protein
MGQDHFTNNGLSGLNIICITEESRHFKTIIEGQEWADCRLSGFFKLRRLRAKNIHTENYLIVWDNDSFQPLADVKKSNALC